MLRLMETTHTIPRLGYSLAEVEIATGLSRASLYRLIAGGQLRTIQHGRRRLVPVEQLTEFMRPRQEEVNAS